jgi:hypothetical protein
MESLVQRIGLDLREHLYTPHILMGRKPPFKILGSSNTIVPQKKLIFILVRVIISPEKNPRKPVSILREGVKDFKLLNHIKLLVTDSSRLLVALLAVDASSRHTHKNERNLQENER